MGLGQPHMVMAPQAPLHRTPTACTNSGGPARTTAASSGSAPRVVISEVLADNKGSTLPEAVIQAVAAKTGVCPCLLPCLLAPHGMAACGLSPLAPAHASGALHGGKWP